MIRLGHAVALLTLTPALGLAQAESTKVTLKLDNSTVPALAAELTESTGLTVMAMPHVQGTVSLDVKEEELEAVLESVADSVEGSWLRTYLIEPPDAEPTEETADEFMSRVRFAWRDWMLRRSDEELDQYRQQAMAALAADPPTPPQMTAAGGVRLDIVAMANGPFHLETVTLKLDAVPLQEALDQLTLKTGYLTLLAPDMGGQVTLEVTEARLPDVLDAIGEQASCRWRPQYVIGQPRDLPPDEVEQRFSDMLREGATQFWQRPPAERADMVQRAAGLLGSLPPDARAAVQGSTLAPRLMGVVMNYVMTLTPDQRREVTPILQGLAKLMTP